ncbi:hypothetical protein SRHO_G00332590 [Serrasalmus rhombeus]
MEKLATRQRKDTKPSASGSKINPVFPRKPRKGECKLTGLLFYTFSGGENRKKPPSAPRMAKQRRLWRPDSADVTRLPPGESADWLRLTPVCSLHEWENADWTLDPEIVSETNLEEDQGLT